MIEVQGKKYIPPKEVSRRFGYSKSFLEKLRQHKKGPEWIKVGEKKRGKIYYELEEVEKWFLKNT